MKVVSFEMRWGEGETETLPIHYGATILTAEIVHSTNASGTDRERLNLFFQLPQDLRLKHERRFVYYYTGTEVKQKNVVYIKSVTHGVLIYHVFEVFHDE